jgi:hypothetical protein
MPRRNEWFVPQGEPVFLVDGLRWQYVRMLTDTGQLEGYYRFDHDLVYVDFRQPYGELAG